MKPIWYFVGLILTAFGLIITLNGLWLLFGSAAQTTVLGELRPGVWWGAIMLVTGLVFYFTSRNKTVE